MLSYSHYRALVHNKQRQTHNKMFYSYAKCLRSQNHMKAIDQHICPILTDVTDCICLRAICIISHSLDMCGNTAAFILVLEAKSH